MQGFTKSHKGIYILCSGAESPHFQVAKTESQCTSNFFFRILNLAKTFKCTGERQIMGYSGRGPKKTVVMG